MADTTDTADALAVLRRQYYALVPAYLLRVPPPAALAPPPAQARLAALLGGPLPLPEPGYRRAFWRRVLPVVEDGVRARAEAGDEDAEVDERLYEAVAELMVGGAGPSSLPRQSWKTFIYDDAVRAPAGEHAASAEQAGCAERTITLREEQIAIQAGTTGLRTWTASLHLGHHVVRARARLLGDGAGRWSPTVELGAGAGFLSVLLAQQGADVVATDLGGGPDDDDAEDAEADGGDSDDGDGAGAGDAAGCTRVRRTPLGRLRANVARNGVGGSVDVRALDWADAQLPPKQRPAVWAELAAARRVVVAADVIYDPELVPLLVAAIDVLVGPGTDGLALVAATIRNEATFALFLSSCESAGLQTATVDVPAVDPANPTFWDTALDRAAEVAIVRITRPVSSML